MMAMLMTTEVSAVTESTALTPLSLAWRRGSPARSLSERGPGGGPEAAAGKSSALAGADGEVLPRIGGVGRVGQRDVVRRLDEPGQAFEVEVDEGRQGLALLGLGLVHVDVEAPADGVAAVLDGLSGRLDAVAAGLGGAGNELGACGILAGGTVNTAEASRAA